jgi:hypothetical protein
VTAFTCSFVIVTGTGGFSEEIAHQRVDLGGEPRRGNDPVHDAERLRLLR